MRQILSLTNRKCQAGRMEKSQLQQILCPEQGLSLNVVFNFISWPM